MGRKEEEIRRGAAQAASKAQSLQQAQMQLVQGRLVQGRLVQGGWLATPCASALQGLPVGCPMVMQMLYCQLEDLMLLPMPA